MIKWKAFVAATLVTTATSTPSRSGEPFPSTYRVPPNPPTLVRNATVLTGTGERLEGADVLISNGKIQSIGTGLTAPADARIIDAQRRLTQAVEARDSEAAGAWMTKHIRDFKRGLELAGINLRHTVMDSKRMTRPAETKLLQPS